MQTPSPAANRRNLPQPVAFFDPQLRYSIPETAALLRQSVPKTWIDIRENKLKVIREGGRTFVPGSEIVRRSRLPQLNSPAVVSGQLVNRT
jgi:hypothetical protein